MIGRRRFLREANINAARRYRRNDLALNLEACERNLLVRETGSSQPIESVLLPGIHSQMCICTTLGQVDNQNRSVDFGPLQSALGPSSSSIYIPLFLVNCISDHLVFTFATFLLCLLLFPFLTRQYVTVDGHILTAKAAATFGGFVAADHFRSLRVVVGRGDCDRSRVIHLLPCYCYYCRFFLVIGCC